MTSVRALFVGVLLALLSLSSYALIPKTSGFEYQADPMPSTQWVFGGAAACQAWIAVANATYGWGASFSAFTEGSSLCQGTSPGGAVGTVLQRRGASMCPANSTASGAECACSAGYEEDPTHTSCQIARVQCNAGDTVSSGYYDAGTSIAGGPPPVVCVGGCTATFDGSFPAGSAMVGGVKHYFARGGYVKFGSNCNSGNGDGMAGGPGNAPPATPDVPSDSCGPGKIMGTVNGKKVCADAGDGGPTPSPSTPETSTDEKKEQSTTTTTTNADGSKTERTTTIVTDVSGGKTTTVKEVTTNADGTPRSSTTTTTGQGPKDEAEEGDKAKCEKNAAEAGCGGEPTAVDGSGLYTKKDKTVATILTNAKNTLTGSPVGAAVTGFFSVSGGGSCPMATGNIPYLNKTVTLDAFCTQSAFNMYLVIKGALLLVASFFAFRVAVE